jgi:hypothetical protein
MIIRAAFFLNFFDIEKNLTNFFPNKKSKISTFPRKILKQKAFQNSPHFFLRNRTKFVGKKNKKKKKQKKERELPIMEICRNFHNFSGIFLAL